MKLPFGISSLQGGRGCQRVRQNSDNAETAIKCFARYRRFADGRFTARSPNEYLLLLSIIQTCEYNNVNVMKYLLSKDRDLDAYIRSFK
jgi:hypothetical protein